ncbi:hypothetical protein K435DRAFT_912248, partial [Dendrothele bispora CBS 962.96]
SPSITPNSTAFGIPWPQGEIDKTNPIAVTTGGTSILQTWSMTYLKWNGHALSTNSGLSDRKLMEPVSVSQSNANITVTTGSFEAKINTFGTTLISLLSLNGSIKTQNGVLVLRLQDAPNEPELTASKTFVIGMQSGPIRAVIKVCSMSVIGKYIGFGHDNFLSFIVRLFISTGGNSIRMIHLFIHGSHITEDFINGMPFLSPPLSPMNSTINMSDSSLPLEVSGVNVYS